METRTVIWPVSRFICSGIQTAKVRVVTVTEHWFAGESWETSETTEEEFEINVPEPNPGSRTFFWLDDIFGNFEECNHPGFVVVRDDDVKFWSNGSKSVFLADLMVRNREGISSLAERHGWDLDTDGMPLPPIRTFSKAVFEDKNKKLMAHIVVEVGIFKSVGEAKRNGWDKPIETGEFCLTKRKIRFKVVD